MLGRWFCCVGWADCAGRAINTGRRGVMQRSQCRERWEGQQGVAGLWRLEQQCQQGGEDQAGCHNSIVQRGQLTGRAPACVPRRGPGLTTVVGRAGWLAAAVSRAGGGGQCAARGKSAGLNSIGGSVGAVRFIVRWLCHRELRGWQVAGRFAIGCTFGGRRSLWGRRWGEGLHRRRCRRRRLLSCGSSSCFLLSAGGNSHGRLGRWLFMGGWCQGCARHPRRGCSRSSDLPRARVPLRCSCRGRAGRRPRRRRLASGSRGLGRVLRARELLAAQGPVVDAQRPRRLLVQHPAQLACGRGSTACNNKSGGRGRCVARHLQPWRRSEPFLRASTHACCTGAAEGRRRAGRGGWGAGVLRRAAPAALSPLVGCTSCTGRAPGSDCTSSARCTTSALPCRWNGTRGRQARRTQHQRQEPNDA